MALRNDCFALPTGVNWTPFDTALDALRARLSPVVSPETLPLSQCSGRVLAQDCIARRANPGQDNAAVDGYALAATSLTGEGEQRLTLIDGRSAAGVPFAGSMPPGTALRILTGAAMPEGTDSVVMDEDVDLHGSEIRFGSGLKTGANRRLAGEDIRAGAVAVAAGVRLGPQHLAQAAAVGVSKLSVFRPLRVAIMSTGDELRAPEADAPAGAVFDANRPMLMALAARAGCEMIDLGIIPDDRARVIAALRDGAASADAVIASGGASGGDEDHVSRALGDLGALHTWRIAMKPGRPLALGQVDGAPIFGLPGNPVAAFVCFLTVLRPALAVLGGAAWPEPIPIPLLTETPLRKKPGRAEFLRGRIRPNGRVERFRSDGSGLISGLCWSDGLIALDHARGPVAAGERVDFLPFSLLGV